MNRAEELYKRFINNGEAAIDDFIADRVSEELFLDFKRSSNNGESAKLSQNDRNNLAKAISGFGNSSGGLIIWGVDCSPDFDGADVARAKVPIVNVDRFLANINGAISGCTIPAHSKVECHSIKIAGSENGFAATFVPESENPPHQVVGKLQYYIRAGSDFVPTPHQVLAGMFGKKPQPNVFQMFTSHPLRSEGENLLIDIGVQTANGGPGIARDLFLTATVCNFIGDNSQISFEPIDQNWSGNQNFGIMFSLISNENIRVPPKAFLTPVVVHLILRPPFTDSLKIEANVGCTGSPTYSFTIEAAQDDIQRNYDLYFEHLNAGTFTNAIGHEIIGAIINTLEADGADA